MFRFCFFLIFFVSCLFSKGEAFDKVIIWGYKLHTHTHSYIHNGFYRAFSSLGYKTYWFDKDDKLENFDFSNSLFITAGNADEQIPLREDCFYILHNCLNQKYQELYEKKRYINLQVYTDYVLTVPTMQKKASCIYYDLPNRTVYMPWATDLLPHEIDAVKAELPTIKRGKKICWIGTIGKEGRFSNWSEIAPFVKAAKRNGIKFYHNDPWKHGISIEENMRLIKTAYLAPALVGKWQKKQGYIPCRIFKNISYGQIGVTNSLRVFELFEQKIVFNRNTTQLFYDAQVRLKNTTLGEQYELMDFVKTKHTFINRVETLLDFIEAVKKNQVIEKNDFVP